ncbi:hypothetical protein J2T20_005008 [Paenibacillus wynnii]|nr:hypothetical protein [Paenibacillus wynnii]
MNQHYQLIKTLTAQEGFTSDLHEFTITKQNTALFTALTSAGRSNPVWRSGKRFF